MPSTNIRKHMRLGTVVVAAVFVASLFGAFWMGSTLHDRPESPTAAVRHRLQRAYPALRVTRVQAIPSAHPVLFAARTASHAIVLTDRHVTFIVPVSTTGGVPITGPQDHAIVWLPQDGGVILAPHAMNTPPATTTALASPLAPPARSMPPSSPPSAVASSAAPAAPASVADATPPAATPPVVPILNDHGVLAAQKGLGPLKNPAAAGLAGEKLFAAIPKGGAMVQQYGKGQRVALAFEDPECPFCQHFEETLAHMGAAANLRLIVVPFPLTLITRTPKGAWQAGGTHPQAMAMSQYLMCTPHPTLDWHSWMVTAAQTLRRDCADTPTAACAEHSARAAWTTWTATHPSASTWSLQDPARPGCARARFINLTLAVGLHIGVNATPTVLLSNGALWHTAGVADAATIQRALHLGSEPLPQVMASPTPAASSGPSPAGPSSDAPPSG